MRSFLKLVLALTIVGFGAPASIAATSKPTVEAVLEAFQTEKFLGEAMADFTVALDRRDREIGISAARIKELRGLAKRIYTGRNMFNVFKVGYAKQTTAENMAALYKWLNTPPGIKLRHAYEQTFAASAEERKTYYDTTGKAVLRPNRQNALQTFLETTKQTELRGIWLWGIDLNVFRALNGYKKPEERESASDIEKYLNQRKKAYATSVGLDHALPFDIYLFKDMKNEDIDEMSKFLTTPFGEAHIKAYAIALEGTLEGAATTIEAQVIKTFASGARGLKK